MAEELGLSPPAARGGASAQSYDEIRPPIALLIVALVAVLVSAALLFASGEWSNLVGYFLATVVSIFAIGFYRREDSRRRSDPMYVVPHIAQVIKPKVASWVLLGVAFVVAALHVYQFADVVARR